MHEYTGKCWQGCCMQFWRETTVEMVGGWWRKIQQQTEREKKCLLWGYKRLFNLKTKSGLHWLFLTGGICKLAFECLVILFYFLHWLRTCFLFPDFPPVAPCILHNKPLWVITVLSLTLPLGFDHIRVPENRAPKQKPTHARKNAQKFCPH